MLLRGYAAIVSPIIRGGNAAHLNEVQERVVGWKTKETTHESGHFTLIRVFIMRRRLWSQTTHTRSQPPYFSSAKRLTSTCEKHPEALKVFVGGGGKKESCWRGTLASRSYNHYCEPALAHKTLLLTTRRGNREKRPRNLIFKTCGGVRVQMNIHVSAPGRESHWVFF